MATLPQLWPESAAGSPLAEDWTSNAHSKSSSANHRRGHSGGVGALAGIFMALLRLLALSSLLSSAQVRSIVQVGYDS